MTLDQRPVLYRWIYPVKFHPPLEESNELIFVEVNTLVFQIHCQITHGKESALGDVLMIFLGILQYYPSHNILMDKCLQAVLRQTSIISSYNAGAGQDWW